MMQRQKFILSIRLDAWHLANFEHEVHYPAAGCRQGGH